MASKAVMDAVAARVRAGWSRARVVDQNVGGTVANDRSAFLAIEYPVANEAMISVGAPGANLFREEGAIRFVLSVPRGQGTNPWAGYVDELRALFRGKTFTGVVTWEAPPPATNHEGETDGYYDMSFAVPYQFDALG